MLLITFNVGISFIRKGSQESTEEEPTVQQKKEPNPRPGNLLEHVRCENLFV